MSVLAQALTSAVMDFAHTAEDLAFRDELREWLDENLPAMVHRVVQAEVARVVREARTS